MQPITAVFFGISGSGKGTQCDLLEKFLTEHDTSRKVVRPEMGNLARSFMETGTSLAVHTKEILGAGALLPSFIPIHLLTQMLNERFTGTEHLILDGTCRRPMQSQAVDEMMRLWQRENLHGVVLNLSKDAARGRLQARGRYDDSSEELLENRFSWYERDVVPAINTLSDCGWTIHEIDGEPDVDTIHQNVLAALGL